jgi:soluble lytic murein transglycosylase-like protein
MIPKNFISVLLCTLLITVSSQASADMYKYLTKDGKTILTGKKLKGSGNKLLKIYRIKKSKAYKSSFKTKKSTSKKSKYKKKKSKRIRSKNKSKVPLNMVKANGRDSGVIVGCNSNKHLGRQARLYKNTIQIYSRIYDVEPELIHAIVRQESCFNEGAHSYVGAIGLMQLMPQTALGLRINDPWNPEHNIQGGIKYIAQMMKRFNGKPKLAIAAYNAGPGNVNKYKGIPPFKETRNYVKKVYAEYLRLKSEGINYSDKIQLASK